MTFLKFFVMALLLGVAYFSTGCSSNQNIYVKNDGSGRADISIQLQPMLMQYVRDIAGGFASGKEVSGLQLFDREKIRKQISTMPHIVVHSIKTPTPENMKISLSFDRISKIFPVSGADTSPALFQFKTKKGSRTLIFTLTKENFNTLTEFLGFGGNELVTTFGPQKDKPLTKDEYTAMIEYLFDDYGSKKQIDSMFNTSYIVVDLTVQGVCKEVESSPDVIVSCKGSHAEIKIPLVDTLTLIHPLFFNITWNQEP